MSLPTAVVRFPFRVMSARGSATNQAFTRAEQLRRGINASIWFAQSAHDYSVERLRTFTTNDDIVLIAKLGFDHIRLSIDAAPLVVWQRSHEATTPFLTQLNHSVKTMLDCDLSVILDLHPESDYKARLHHGEESVQRFVSLWTAIARHFASFDPNRIYFEIMNEPEQVDRLRWQRIQSEAAAAIRRAAPQHTIIATGARWSGLQDLLALEPVAVPNVIYTFHSYEPFNFTHQGATWTAPRVQTLRSVPYPSRPDPVSSNLTLAPPLGDEYFVNGYGIDHWTARRVNETIGFAARWSELHQAPVYCGEFGVFRDYAEAAMRAAWLRDMRTALEQNHIGWAMWDYQTNFGVVTKTNGVATPDPAVVQALGLNSVGS